MDIGKNAQDKAGTDQGSTSVCVLSVPHKGCTSLPNSPALIPGRILGSAIHSPLPHNKLLVQAEQMGRGQERTANRRPQRGAGGPVGVRPPRPLLSSLAKDS